MSLLGRIRTAFARRAGVRAPLPIWHHPHYTMPLTDLEQTVGIETRRGDLALWALLEGRNRKKIAVHEPLKVGYGPLGLVHTEDYLHGLTQSAGLAKVLGLDLPSLPIDSVLTTFRLAVGGTVEATRFALREKTATLNLLGGFHHAYPDRGAGLCAFNDLAVALQVARRDGFIGRLAILDLDAHPPDGTAACFAGDPKVWIGSISGSYWGDLPSVDENVIPNANDEHYLSTLEGLLQRLPSTDLVMVIAGGDVLAGDRLGKLNLSYAGVKRRDQAVLEAIGDRPSVWLPGGGYRPDSWRCLAQTATVLMGEDAHPIPKGLDPLASHFQWLSKGLSPRELGQPDDTFSAEEMDTWFGVRAPPLRLLGFYTTEGIEHALEVFGILDRLTRLGYSGFEVVLSKSTTGDRVQLFGNGGGARHLLWEMVVARETYDNAEVGVIHWMTMRHPLGQFYPGRPKLPGQEAPGLGLAEEALHLVARMAERLHLDGILVRPSWFHSAYIFRSVLQFADPRVQGEFEALIRDLGHLPLPVLTQAIADGKVKRNDQPWRWTAEPMVAWRSRPRPEKIPSNAKFSLSIEEGAATESST